MKSWIVSTCDCNYYFAFPGMEAWSAGLDCTVFFIIQMCLTVIIVNHNGCFCQCNTRSKNGHVGTISCSADEYYFAINTLALLDIDFSIVFFLFLLNQFIIKHIFSEKIVLFRYWRNLGAKPKTTRRELCSDTTLWGMVLIHSPNMNKTLHAILLNLVCQMCHHQQCKIVFLSAYTIK